MGSSMDSRYWVCPSCFKQFDWEKDGDKIRTHDPKTCNHREYAKHLREKIAATDKPQPPSLDNTHHADDATLAYIAQLEAENRALAAQVEGALLALEKIAEHPISGVSVVPARRVRQMAKEALSTLTNSAAAVARIEAGEGEFEIWQDGTMQASTSGPRITAAREALHYESQYGQDGPVQVFEVTRTPITAAGLRRLAEQKEQGAE